jgi:hypothetical protein
MPTRKFVKMKQFVGPTIKPGDMNFPMQILYHCSISSSGGGGSDNSSSIDDNDGGGGCFVQGNSRLDDSLSKQIVGNVLWAGQRSLLTLLQARIKHWKEGANE